MPYEPQDIPETASILGVAFVVGVIAQYLKQKTATDPDGPSTVWIALASGFSAMVTIGLLYEYTSITGAFLVAIAGIAGWTGISLLTTLSKIFEQLLSKTAEKKFDVKLDSTKKEVNDTHDLTPATTGSQSE